MTDEAKLVKRIIKRYGEVINLKDNPSAIVDIIRQFGLGADEPGTPDGGLPPGGTPPPPPGPTSFIGGVRNEDLMKVMLKLSRDVAQVKAQTATKTTAARAAAAPKRAKSKRGKGR
jgi:hypothetical protein